MTDSTPEQEACINRVLTNPYRIPNSLNGMVNQSIIDFNHRGINIITAEDLDCFSKEKLPRQQGFIVLD